MRKIIFLLLTSILLIAVACNSGYKADNKDDVSSLNRSANAEAETYKITATDSAITGQEFQLDEDKQQQQQPADPKQKKQPTSTTTNEPAAQPDWDKKIIKNAVLDAEVKDFNAFTKDLREKSGTSAAILPVKNKARPNTRSKM